MSAAMHDDSAPATPDSDVSRPRGPKVIASYSSGYRPPFDVTTIAERMVDSVPPKYLVGLSEVVLTNASGFSRKRRRSVTKSRKKKVKTRTALGVYHPAWKGRAPWIEIFVDNALSRLGKGLLLKFSLFRELALDKVVFHEIGHHIHYTVRPEHREKEDVADVWMVRLERNYWQQRSGVVRLLLRFLRLVAAPVINWLHLRTMKHQRKKGWISHAEFAERMQKRPSKPKQL